MAATATKLDQNADTPKMQSRPKLAVVPSRTDIQRREALDKANLVRTKRKELKRDIGARRIDLATVIAGHENGQIPWWLETMKIVDLILAAPKYGRVKSNKVLTTCRISPSKTIGGLSERQRTEIVSLLRR